MTALRANEIFSNSGIKLIAIESVDYQYSRTTTRCQVYGNIKPIAVIVCGSEGIYALDMESKPADLGQLRQDIPELDALVSNFHHARDCESIGGKGWGEGIKNNQ